MRIEKDIIETMQFVDLPVGQLFRFVDNDSIGICLKVEDCCLVNNDYCFNAVDLESSEILECNYYDKVIPLDGYLKVKDIC
jgi:hypothetical protein